jgi:hypothetical protein
MTGEPELQRLSGRREMKMKAHSWSGRWPTDEYPPDGARIRYERGGLCADAETKESTVASVWCGVEPVIELANGDALFTWDPWEAVNG